MPTMRSGVDVADAISVTESADVFVASTASARQTRSSSREQLLLRAELLDDRLDHDVAVGEVGELASSARGGRCRTLSIWPFSTLRVRKCVDAGARLLPQLGGHLAPDGLDAGLDAELRDARAHRAQSDDSDLHLREGAYVAARAARSEHRRRRRDRARRVKPTPRARKPIAGPLTTPPV